MNPNVILAWNLALKCEKRPGLMKDLFILCSQVSVGLHIVTGNKRHVLRISPKGFMEELIMNQTNLFYIAP